MWFGDELRPTVLNAIKGLGMQYEIFDYGKEKAIEKKDASLFIEKVRAVGDQALELGRTKNSVIPSEISFLKPLSHHI